MKPIKPISRQALYSSISSRADGLIARLLELTKSKNENVALGACKVLLNKVLPDIKSVETVRADLLDKVSKSDETGFEEMADEQQADHVQILQDTLDAYHRTGRYADRRSISPSLG